MGRALELFMERAEITEDVKKAVKELSKLSLKEILAYALRGEIDSTGLYRFLYETLPEGYPREKFREFMEMEKSHDLEVSRIFRSLFPGEPVPKVHLKSWARVFSEKDYRLRTVGDYLRVLELGMDMEELSEMTYLMLEEMLDDVEYKRLMRQLAQDERSHYEFLKKEHEFYSDVHRKMSLKELIEEIRRDKSER